MKKLTALSTITALIAILTTVTNSTPAFSKSNYFAETEPILIEVHYVTSFGSSEDITAPVSSDEAATSTDKATVSSLKDEDSSRSSRYWAKESFTVNITSARINLKQHTEDKQRIKISFQLSR